MQFVRFAALVQARGGTVVLECQKKLGPLLSSCPGASRVLEYGSPLPSFDVHCPLLSLPRIFQTTLATVPAPVPYLSARDDLVRTWNQRLKRRARFRVGIVWQGNPEHRFDRQRSVPLVQFCRLAAVPGVELVSVQKGAGREQLTTTLHGCIPVTDPGDDLDTAGGAFLDTAAIMRSLDLVVTSDTAAAHLAGALGVPVWVAISFLPDWRWLLERPDTPWYPSMRLFRQPRPGAWDGVFRRIESELRALVES